MLSEKKQTFMAWYCSVDASDVRATMANIAKKVAVQATQQNRMRFVGTLQTEKRQESVFR